ncbi:hypothetical protein RXV90_16515 [Rhodophyticola sp. MJ-SS7]|nr:hypothetical protein [Rhodophyticola sp. MJ-SS7]
MTPANRDLTAALLVGLARRLTVLGSPVEVAGAPREAFIYHEQVGEWEDVCMMFWRMGLSRAAMRADDPPKSWRETYPDGSDRPALPMIFSLPRAADIERWMNNATEAPDVTTLLASYIALGAYGRDADYLPLGRGDWHRPANAEQGDVVRALAAAGYVEAKDGTFRWTDLAFPAMAEADAWTEEDILPGEIDETKCDGALCAIHARLTAGEAPPGQDAPLLRIGIGPRAVLLRRHWDGTAWVDGSVTPPQLSIGEALRISAALWDLPDPGSS